MSRSASQTRVYTGLLASVGLFAFFVALFLILRSNQFVAVDGALRCLAVYHNPHLFFHGNNHLLYPVNILLWTKLAAALGFVANTPTEYIHLSQALNSICAAATLLFVWLLITRITSDRLLALVLVSMYGFSRAFVLHATNSAEPVVGLMFSIAALFVLRQGLRYSRDSRNVSATLVGLAGLLMALAFASYQAMFLSFLFCLWLCIFDRPEPHASVLARAKTVFVFGLSCALGIALIFGWAYSTEGIPIGPQMVRQFTGIAGSEAGYGKFSLSKVVNFPIGLANNLVQVVPDGYQGIRGLLKSHQSTWLLAVAAIGCLVLFLLIAFARPAIQAYRTSSPADRRMYSLGLVSLIPLLLAIIIWDPLYDKLWLLPFGILIVAFAYSAERAPMSWEMRNTAVALSLVLIAIEIPANLRSAIVDSRSETEGLKDATRVMSVVKPDDAIVLDFDPLSSLFIAYSGNGNAIMLPTMLRAEAARAINTQLARCHETHTKFYFLGILDQPEAVWKPFLEARLGIPYSSFDHYRSQSRTVERFLVRNHAITLRVYEPSGRLPW